MDPSSPAPGPAPAPDPIAELITTYNELNGPGVEELSSEPSPLEFMRYVARNTPFVVRGAAADWPAIRTWTAAYLRNALGRHPVNVAVTPYGNADAPTLLEPEAGEAGEAGPESRPEPELVFAKPHEEDQPFEDFLAFLTRQELEPIASFPEGEREVRYAQTQNDNLRHEYAGLFSAVQPTIGFAREALGREPEAINMWVGNSFSATALHRDNYENVYVQVAGRKHFALLPPLCQPCVNEQDLVPATYVRNPDGALELRRDADLALGKAAVGAEAASGDADGSGGSGCEKVPFAIWDPELPDRRSTPYSHLARPVEVTLNPGDMLYLPAMWYHKVSQSCSDDGMCVAVNYWYDMDFSGPLYPLSGFVRDVYRKGLE